MMNDSTTETLELQKKRRDAEAYARVRLLSGILNLNVDSIPWIMSNIDCFVSQSQGNERVEDVYLHPYAFNGHADGDWDNVGQAIGNLQELKRLCIYTPSNHENEVVPIPAWEILARIFSHVRQRITLTIIIHASEWRVEDVQALARAIHGHPTITCFEGGGRLPYESLDTLHSALATLPALESVKLSAPPEDEISLANPESLADLLQVPTLRFVRFNNFSFTPALCQAAANAFIGGAAVTKLEFSSCSFAALECAVMMANGLARNTSVS
jgi:hypothetical protein